MFKNQNKSKGDYQESIGKGSTITGDIVSENNFRLDGNLIGSLRTTAKVVTGPQSSIEGKLNCQSACIAGKLNGEIHVNGHLLIQKTANISGEIYSKSLEIEEGAVVEAHCKITKSQKQENKLTKVIKDKKIAS